MINGKYLFEIFPDYTEKELIRAYSILPKNSKRIMALTFGDKLNEKGSLKKLDNTQRRILVSILKGTFTSFLKYNRNGKKERGEGRKFFRLTDNVVDDTFRRVTYRPLSMEEETEKIKKAKLAFYDEVDLETKKLYLDYYFEVTPDFKEKYESASEEEKESLLRREIKKAEKEKKKFLLNNLGLIRIFIKKSQDLIPQEDLFQVGNIGLITALKKFDFSYNDRFSTYAYGWIRQSVSRYIVNNCSEIRVPSNTLDDVKKLKKVTKELENEIGRTPTDSEISEVLKYKKDKIRRIKMAIMSSDVSSLDEPVLSHSYSSDDPDSLGNLIPDEKSLFENESDERMMVDEFVELVNTLDERTRDIILLRNGFKDGIPRTAEYIGSRLHLSRTRVCTIEKEGYEKVLRRYNKRHGKIS